VTEEEKRDGGLVAELYALGSQLTAAVKSLWESEDSRRLRDEIGEGFMELGRQLDSAVKSAQDSETAKQFSEQVKDAVDKARDSEIVEQLEEGLVTGLRELNAAIAKLVDSLATHTTPSQPTAGEEGTPPEEQTGA
jgi:S-methylmethionine-dependent homocysteine/selenocysteine methylase